MPLEIQIGDRRVDGFMSLVRGPYLRQLTGTEQPRQLDRVPAVRLHAVSGPTRDQRRGDHRAGVTKFLYLALQPVTCRTSLVTEVQPWDPTSPLRPSSATATAWLSFDTSHPIKVL